MWIRLRIILQQTKADSDEQANRWLDEVIAPSAIAYKDKNIIPQKLSLEWIQVLIDAWGSTTKQAVQAGFNVSGFKSVSEIICPFG